MRMKPQEIEVIKSIISKNLGEVEIYLFGSRVNDNAKGGDIDILIIGQAERNPKAMSRIRIELEEKLGEQKIDLVYQPKNQMTPFGQLAVMEGILL